MADEKLHRKEIPLTGKVITSEDPAMIGTNFRQLTNMRYTRTHPKGIGGHSKINTTALTNPKIRSGIHFRKDQPAESHVLVEAYNSGLSSSEIYQNTTAIPGTGDFGSSIYTPTAGADRGRWSLAPDGYVAYANGEETCLWGGDESQIGGFVNYDPADSFFRDLTDQVSNTIETGSGNVAVLNRVSQSTTNNMLLLHFENNVTDNSPTTVHTVTNNNVTFSTTNVFGTYAASFNGTTAYLSIPDNADFDFSAGTFCIDARVRADNFTTDQVLYYQKTDIESVAFTLGTSEIEAGDTITGDTSTETAIVDYVDVTSGTWGGGDAAGTLYVHTVSGVFQNEVVNVGVTNSATIGDDFSDHGDNYIKFYITTGGLVRLLIHECYGAGSDVIDFSTPAISSATYYHIELDENGDDWYIFVDGQQKAVLNDASRAKNYISPVLIGYDNTSFYDGFLDEYRVSNIARHVANFEVPSSAYSNAAGGTTDTYLYVGSILPLEGIKFYIETANTTASTATVYYWSGADWTAVSNLSDGTAVTGASFAQTGSLTFDSTASVAKVKEINGVVLYWYRVIVTTLDDNVGVYYVTVKTPFQKIKDIWDGLSRQLVSFYKYSTVYNDYTGNVREDDYDSGDAATYINLNGLTTSEYLICGFEERQAGLRFNIVGAKGNDTANTVATISYWDGADWVSVGSISDNTSEGNISFAQSGLVTWNALSDGVEFQTEFTGAPKDEESVLGTTAPSPSLYYYKISFNQTLSGDASNHLYLVTITGIPAQTSISEYKFPVNAMDRLWLFSDQKGRKNVSVCSAESTTNVFNGYDSIELYWGDESEVVCAAWLYSQYGASIYSILLVFKRNEMWALIGNDPGEWKQYKVSSIIGCVAPETMKVIDLPSDKSQGVNRSSVVLFQGPNGVYMTDGRPPVLITPDISDLFDKRESKITQSLITNSFSFVDKEKMEYHWCFAQGSSIDYEFVFDYTDMKWFNIDRPSALQAGIEVEDTNGVTYTYGAIDTGFLLRLEHGNSFDGTAITQTMWFGDMVLAGDGIVTIETEACYHILIAETKTTTNDITVTHYGDTETTGTDMTLVPRKSGYRTIRAVKHKKIGPHLFHSWKFVISTDDETTGFSPLFFACLFKQIRDYTRDHRS